MTIFWLRDRDTQPTSRRLNCSCCVIDALGLGRVKRSYRVSRIPLPAFHATLMQYLPLFLIVSPLIGLFSLLRAKLKFVLLLLALWVSLGTSSISFARELPLKTPKTITGLEQPAQNYPTFDANTIPSEKVSQFVRAYLQVLDLINRRESDLQAAETELESRRLEREIEAEAFFIIEQAGLSRQEYLQLLSLANADPEFGERVAAQLQEAGT